jgi:hypothetical protein
MKKKNIAQKPTKGNKEVVPLSESSGAEWFGCMKGTVEILGDIIAPANDEDDWAVLRDWTDDPSKLS